MYSDSLLYFGKVNNKKAFEWNDLWCMIVEIFLSDTHYTM